MKLSLLSLFLAFNAFATAEETCAQFNLRHIYNSEVVKLSKTICKSTVGDFGDCKDLCMAKEALAATGGTMESLMNKFGNPYYQACYKANGKPQTYEIEVAGKWEKGSYCLFLDNSFVDTAALLKKFK